MSRGLGDVYKRQAMTGFNLGCVDEVKVEELKEVAYFDGLNHPMDQEK